MSEHWTYPDTDAPLLWAEGIRRYVVNGECVADAVGGGFYTKPTIQINKEPLVLQPIDVTALSAKNADLMAGLEQNAINFIRKTHRTYAQMGYAFVVAFSGGKDSLVVLDLVSRALPPDEFYVIFSNTGMELSCTLEAVEAAKKHWPSLRFYEAKSHLSPLESWDMFGPPGRRMRWCCTVHKSAPTILKLRQITGNYNVKAVVFDGVRAEESARRAAYEEISVGAKNINQVNCSPILKWNSAELFIYLLRHNLLFNKAYRLGMNRVGCTVCPLSSSWRDSLCSFHYRSEIEPLLNKVESYTHQIGIPYKREKDYIERNGWRTRMGGKGLPNGGNRVNEQVKDDTLFLQLSERRQKWENVTRLLGPILSLENNRGVQNINNNEYVFSIDYNKNIITYYPFHLIDRFTLSHLRGVANKTAYCVGCKACMVQCPNDAFVIDEDGKIFIREDKCSHCANCVSLAHGKGCLVAQSLATTEGAGMNLKGMNRYQTFGLRQAFLEHFFENKADCFSMNKLGTRQYAALKVWLKEAELMMPANKGEASGTPTQLFSKLEKIGPYNPLTWAIIWVNLAYNSVICRWYMLHCDAGESYEKGDLVVLLGDEYSPTTRENAVTSLCETLRDSPIGTALKQGIPIKAGKTTKYLRAGWDNPDPVAILYALYRWAEATNTYTFALHQMFATRANEELTGIEPSAIFGIDEKDFKDMLQALALQMEKYIRVSFVMDLDNVILNPNITSLDIIDIAL